MSDFDNTNRGQCWKNKNKGKDDPKGKGRPDFTGSLNVEGRDYYFDGWLRPDDADQKRPAFTFKVKPKDAAPEGHPERFREVPVNRQRPAPVGGELDDDIPFAAEFR